MVEKKSLTKGLIDITVGAAIAGPAISTVGSLGLPAPLRTGTSSLIGVGLLKGAAELAEDKKKRRMI